MKRIIYILVVLFVNSLSQPISVTISKDSIFIGDRINLRFNIDLKENNEVEIYSWDNLLPPSVEIKDQFSWIDSLQGNKKRIIDYHIACYDTGAVTLPPFKITINGNGLKDSIQIYSTDSIYLYVNSVLPDSAKGILELKGPEAFPFPWMKWIAGTVIVIFMLLGAYTIIKKIFKKNIISIEEERIKTPAHEIAYQKLDKLNPDKIYEWEQAKLYYFDLSFIIREYLENRFHYNYLEKTTYELKDKLKKDILDSNIYDEIIRFLNLSDKVKFAKNFPEKHLHIKMKNTAIKIVDLTKIDNEHITDDNNLVKDEIENKNSSF